MARGGFNSQDYRMSRTKIFRRRRVFLGGAGGDMEGGLDNAAREVDTERFNLVKTMEERWKLKKEFFKDYISIFFRIDLTKKSLCK